MNNVYDERVLQETGWGNYSEVKKITVIVLRSKPNNNSYIYIRDYKTIECGKYDLGDGNFVNVMDVQGKGDDYVTTKMEGHIKYIDVQLPIIENEILIFDDIKNCNETEKYNEEKDVKFVFSNTYKTCGVRENEFMILFPEDAHYAYKIKSGKKAVFKIKV